MRLRIAIPEEHVGPDVINAGLEAVTRLNEKLIANGSVPTFDEALKAGVRWQPEPPGDESFDHAGMVMQRGWGDCDDLGPYKAATMRVTGEDPNATSYIERVGPQRWHAVVASKGKRLDPSADAGMGASVSGLSGGAGPAACAQMTPRRVAVAVYPDDRVGGWHARADLPWGPTGFSLSSTARNATGVGAIAHAIAGALQVGECAGCALPGHVGRLVALDQVLRGVHPADVASDLRAQGLADYMGAVSSAQRVAGAIGAMLRR